METTLEAVRFLRTSAAAERCGLSPRTLEKLRLKGDGPPYIRPQGRRFVVYDPADLDAWLRAGRRFSTSDTVARRG
jgi:predicted DNA-binding transcriptional regulator AlpA